MDTSKTSVGHTIHISQHSIAVLDELLASAGRQSEAAIATVLHMDMR